MRVSGDAFITAAITAFVGLITALATWRAGHRHGQASFVSAVHQAAHIVIQDLRDELARITEIREQIEAQHAQCQAELAEMRTRIDDLMRGPPASY